METTTDADELVIGWFGRMGSGKTMNMTKWAIMFSEKSGKQIYSNYHINHKNAHYFKKYQELENVRNAIICYDEIHVDQDSRNWDSKSQQKFSHWVTQTRKMYNSFFYTSQTLDQLEKRIRNNTLYVFFCSKNRYKNEMYEDLYDTQMGFGSSVYLKRFVFNKPWLLFNYYNTRELIHETYTKEG